MYDQQQRNRQRRISPPEAEDVHAAPPSQFYAPYSIWTLGVVRNVVGNLITWQRLRYKRGQVPTIGQYTAYGPIENGYPLEGKRAADYTLLKLVGGPTTATIPIRAAWRGRYWIIEFIDSQNNWQLTLIPVNLCVPGPTCLPDDGSGGGQGTAHSPATWKYRVFDARTGTLLAALVDPSECVNSGRPDDPCIVPWKRPECGQMSKATFGYAIRGPDGKIYLTWINEQLVQGACP